MKTVRVARGEKKVFVDDFEKAHDDIVYEVSEDAHVTVVMVAYGSHDWRRHVRLVGRRASADMLGCIIGAGEGSVMLHTLQLHEAPEATSNLLVKCVLKDNAQFTFDGAIRVEKNAQKTDAYQRNENLLLSSSAHARSKPSLEILANDVRCTHGATLGTIDNEQLYYLQSRGIGGNVAKQLIIDGFFESLLTKVGDARAAESVRNILWQHL